MTLLHKSAQHWEDLLDPRDRFADRLRGFRNTYLGLGVDRNHQSVAALEQWLQGANAVEDGDAVTRTEQHRHDQELERNMANPLRGYHTSCPRALGAERSNQMRMLEDEFAVAVLLFDDLTSELVTNVLELEVVCFLGELDIGVEFFERQ
jgi:hypothetical protein